MEELAGERVTGASYLADARGLLATRGAIAMDGDVMPLKRFLHSRLVLTGCALVLLAGGAAWLVHRSPSGTATIASMPQRSPDAPRRVVSINLCADQLVLALADKDQIAGLTNFAVDPEMSGEAARAHGHRLLDGSAEEILAINPDLVIGMPASGSPVLTALKGRSYPTLDLALADRYEDVEASIRQVASALGHKERGEALIAQMKAQLAALPQAPGQGRVAAYYQRRGYMTGTGTLVDDLMTRMGLVNLARKLDKPLLAQMSLEEMAAARPDYLIVESATDQVQDQGTEMLHHPALRGIKRISIPEAWTVCGSPAYVDAAKAIAQAVAGH